MQTLKTALGFGLKFKNSIQSQSICFAFNDRALNFIRFCIKRKNHNASSFDKKDENVRLMQILVNTLGFWLLCKNSIESQIFGFHNNIEP